MDELLSRSGSSRRIWSYYRGVAQTTSSQRVGVARELAAGLLDGQPDRWQHTIGVARRADELADTVSTKDRDVLFVAAWLHDIGYSPALADSGFHPLDGARYLDTHGWPARICSLVAHHSAAECLAPTPELRQALAMFAREDSPVADALAYADQTTGPTGQPMTLDERLADSLIRCGPAQAEARHARQPLLRNVEARVLGRLQATRDAEPRGPTSS